MGGGNFEGGREGSALPGDDGVFLEIANITHWKEGEGGIGCGGGGRRAWGLLRKKGFEAKVAFLIPLFTVLFRIIAWFPQKFVEEIVMYYNSPYITF